MSIWDSYKKAALASNRPLTQLLSEAVRLRVSQTRLGLSEYINFQLYKQDISWEEKRAFIGWRTERVIEDILVDDYSRFLSLSTK